MTNVPKASYLQIADKYGMITVGLQQLLDTSQTAVALLDQRLQQILRSFAIDPDKIAIVGRCGPGPGVYGPLNPQVFSRVLTATIGDLPATAPAPRAEYLFPVGLLEPGVDFWSVQRLRDRGYTVKHSLQFRSHAHTYEGYDFLGHWLQEIPTPRRGPCRIPSATRRC
jgi:hypothetical protein